MMITKVVRLDVTPARIPPVINLNQYDSDFSIVFNIFSSNGSFELESGTTATIQGTKTDGVVYSASATVDVSNKTVTVAGDVQMTAVAGEQVFELALVKGAATLHTVNFMLRVEKAAVEDGSIPSDPQLQGIQAQCMAYAQYAGSAGFGAPYPAATAAAMTDQTKLYVYLGSETGYTKGDWYYYDSTESAWVSGGAYGAGGGGGGGEGLTDDIKQALLQLAEKVAYIDDDGQDYYDAIYDSFYPPAELVSISAVYTQSGTVYDTDSLDSLKADLVVTAYYDDGTSEPVTAYTLSGTLTAETSTITVSYGGKTTTFNVAVTHPDNSLYNWDFTQSLIDSKQGEEATIGTGVTQSSAGLSFDGSADGWCKLVSMAAYKSTAYTVEMDVTAITYASGNNPTVIGMATTAEGSAADNGLRINIDRWTFKDNSNNWKTPTQNITGADYFNSSTIKFVVNYSGKTWEVYKDSALAISYNPVYQTSNNRDVLTIGTSKASQYLGSGTVIKAFRIYAGVV